MPPANLRCHEAEYFFHCFLRACGGPDHHDDYFTMIAFFDAYLFSIVSIEDMVAKDERALLHNIDLFRFLKALRNVTSHHSVLAGPSIGWKFERPFSRHVSENFSKGVPIPAKLELRFDVLRRIFDAVQQERPRERKTLDRARAYMSRLEAEQAPVFIDTVMREGIVVVRASLANPPTPSDS